MAYLIFTANHEEIVRRELKGALSIGRASDCGICVRDIMMSRTHCRVEQQGDTWILTDLQSRNGTFIGHERVEQHLLREGDSLRMGRTLMTFSMGKFEPVKKEKPARVRPVDPNESFAGTVVGFELLEPGEAEYDEDMPIPQPRPLEPAGYESDGVHGLLNEIASSAWNSIHEKTASTLRSQNSAGQARIMGKPKARAKSRVSFALQAHQPKDRIHAAKTGDDSDPVRRKLSRGERRVAAVLLSLAAALVVSAAWLAVESNFPGKISAGEIAKNTTHAPVPTESAEVATHTESLKDAPAEEILWKGAESGQASDAPAQPQLPDPKIVARALLYTIFTH
jgi:pSer/pThr/pTyr-binding forkhead associated (FHA) protein